MSYTIGDGMVALALAAGIVGSLYVTRQSRQKRLEIIHRERMAAMEKGLPLLEFPTEAERPRPDQANVIPIMGTVFFSLSVGAMIVLYFILPVESHSIWISPLPLSFLGLGFIAFHFLTTRPGR